LEDRNAAASYSFLQSHREAFHNFTLLAVFAPAHVALALICLALGTMGGVPWIATLLFAGGTVGMALLWSLRAQTRGDDPILLGSPERPPPDVS
jgi:hypothetical protein